MLSPSKNPPASKNTRKFIRLTLRRRVGTSNEDRLTERRSKECGRREAVDRSATGCGATNVSEFEVPVGRRAGA